MDERAPGRADVRERARSAATAPTVAVEAGAHGAPGSVVPVAVRVRNVAGSAQDVHVHAVGLEPGWAPRAFTVPALGPQATAGADLDVTVPEGAAAGTYPFLVVVESPGGRTLVDAHVTVDGASELLVSVEPADARGRGRRRVDVVLAHTGRTPTAVTLTAVGDGVDVDLPAGRVALAPGQTVRVPAVLRARTRVVGRVRRHPWTVTATGRAAPQRAAGTFTSRAWLGAGLLKVTAVVAVLAVWTVGAVVALPRVVERLDAGQQQDVAPAAGGDGAGAEVDGTDGAGGSGADGPAGDAPPGATGGTRDAAGTVRASGRVSGTDPAGATVQVVPASELWGSTAEVGGSSGTASGTASTLRLVGSVPDPVAGAAVAPATAPGSGAAAGGTGKLLGTALPVEGTGTAAQRVRTTTGEGGTWAVGGLSATARYLVVVAKPGYATQRVLLTGAELAASPLQTELRAGDGVLQGVVRGPAGPVGGVEVTLTDGRTTVTTRSVTAGDVGRWQVEGLSTPATYLVSVSSPEWGSQSVLVPMAAAAERTVDLAVVPGRASLTGTAVGTDTLGGVGGLGGLTVTATDGTTTRTATTLTGDDAGRFVLADLPAPGTYTVTVEGRGYAAVTRRLEVTSAGVRDWEVAMTALGGAVVGTVRAEGGAGLTAAGLVLSGGEHTYKTMSSSDGQGSFRFAGVHAGTYVLSAESFGHVTGYAEVTVGAGGTATADLVLTVVPGDGLQATSSVTGRVTDAATGGRIDCGPAAATCRVTVSTTAQALDGTSRTLTATAGPDDPWVLPGDGVGTLLPGRYRVQVEAPGYEPGTVDVTVGMGAVAEAATVALVPSPSLVGTVLPRVGALPAGVCVVARPAGSDTTCAPATGTCTASDARCAVVDQSMYELRRLPAGSYEVLVAGLPDEWVVPDPVEVTLLPGETKRYDATIERLGVIRVTTLRSDARGGIRVASGVTVTATPVGGGATVTAVSGDDGVAQLTRLTNGGWRLVATTDAGRASDATVREISLNQQLDATLVISDPVDTRTIQVVVQSAADAYQPVPGATVTVTGTTGYDGTLPVRSSVDFTADANGSVTVCTAPVGACAGRTVINLVTEHVDLRVAATGFETHLSANVELPASERVVLTPSFQRLAAVLDVAPGASGTTGLTFEVVQAPPGTGTLRVTPAATGSPSPDRTDATRFALTFVDSAIGFENRIRPGTYRIAVRGAGVTASPAGGELVVEVPVRTGDPATEVPARWLVERDGRVSVTLVPDVGAVGAARLTLRSGGEVVVSRDVTGSAPVDLGSRPVGDYEVEVVAAGYRADGAVPLTVPAGTTASARVPLVQLGRVTGTVSTRLSDRWSVALPGATVSALGPATAQGPATVRLDTTSGTDGGYTLTGTLDTTGLHAGTWALSASAEHHEPTTAEPVAVGSGPVAADLALAPLPSTLTVRVVDRGGATVTENLGVRLAYSDHDVTVPTPQVVDGEFVFADLLPLTYTLWVVPATGEYTTVSTRVTVGPGQPNRVEVPLATPTGSVQGTLTGERADGGTVPLDGVDVTLTPDGATTGRTVRTGDDGRYVLADLEGGGYRLAFTWQGTAVTRVVQVLPGQGVVLDVHVPAGRHAVTVRVTSDIGADLTGGLVTLETASGARLGPQPLSRAASGFTAVFPQVPAGTWTARASGPAGHVGSVASAATAVSGSTTITLALDEVELRLRAVGGTGAGPTVTLTVTPTAPGAAPTAVRLLPGASDSVLHLPRPASGGSATLAATAPDGWEVALSHTSVPAGTTQLLVTATASTGTTTGVTVPRTVVAGTSVAVEVVVGSGAGTPTGRVEVTSGTTPAWETAVPGTLAGGRATVTLPTTGWAAGRRVVHVRYVPDAPGWRASTGTGTVTVTAAPGPTPTPTPSPTSTPAPTPAPPPAPPADGDAGTP